MTKRKTPTGVKVARAILWAPAIPFLLIPLLYAVVLSPLFYWITGYELLDWGPPND